MRISFLLSFCVLSLLSLNSCDDLWEKRQKKKCGGETSKGYYFDIPYTFTPEKDTLTVGDTIWIESKFSNQMYNHKDEQIYTLDDFDFKVFCGIADLNIDPHISLLDFTLINEDATIDNISSKTFIVMDYDFDKDEYRWKKGVVLQKKGLFVFMISSDIAGENLQNQSPSQRIMPTCNNEFLIPNFKRINGKSNHYLLQSAADPYVRSWFDESFRSWTAFYVKG